MASALLVGSYLALLKFSTRYPPLQMASADTPLTVLPEIGPTLTSGLNCLLPVVALIWNLMVEKLSPALSASWATVFLMLILVTQRPLRAWMSGQASGFNLFWQGVGKLHRGLVAGARNMIGIGLATAAAGIIVGAVTLTGVGLIMTEFVELISGGNVLVMLALVAVICLILGMGLPTTANCIVVFTLMAPVVVELGAQNGLLVPLIAVHLFVFYFGFMADVTPPVGLAAYAAAGIVRTDPIKTGITAFGYSARTAVLPFMVIFNTQLLLLDIGSTWELAVTIVSATVANLVFVAATQGWFVTRNRWWETALMLLLTFSLFRPAFWVDRVAPPHTLVPAAELADIIEDAPPGDSLRVWLEGEDLYGRQISKGVLLPLGGAGPARERLAQAGLRVLRGDDGMQVIAVKFGSVADKLGVEQGTVMSRAEVARPRPSKNWMLLPAYLLLGLLATWQMRRARTSARREPALA